MKKNTTMVIGVVVVLIILVAGYAVLHKSKNTPGYSSTGQSNTSSTSNVNSAILTTKTDPTLGQYLAGASGMALYTYDGDTSGVSNCTGACLTSWPAYVATQSSISLPKGVGTIKRADNGQTQYTYNGMPLYYFVGDSVGHVTGNGVSNFSIAKPAATSSSQSTTSTPAASASQSSSNTNAY